MLISSLMWFILYNMGLGLFIYLHYSKMRLKAFLALIDETRDAYPKVFKSMGVWNFDKLNPYFHRKIWISWRKFAYKYFWSRVPAENGYQNFMYCKFLVNFGLCLIWHFIYWPAVGSITLSLASNSAEFTHNLTTNWDLYNVTIHVIWLTIPAIFLWLPYALNYGYGSHKSWKKNAYIKHLSKTAFEIDQAILKQGVDQNREVLVSTYGLDVMHK